LMTLRGEVPLSEQLRVKGKVKEFVAGDGVITYPERDVLRRFLWDVRAENSAANELLMVRQQEVERRQTLDLKITLLSTEP